MIFIKNGKFINVEKDDFEPREKMLERGWFAINVLINNPQMGRDEIIKLSKIWSNIKYDKCKYSDLIHALIKKNTLS
jgi:hypothetical protein